MTQQSKTSYGIFDPFTPHVQQPAHFYSANEGYGTSGNDGYNTFTGMMRKKDIFDPSVELVYQLQPVSEIPIIAPETQIVDLNQYCLCDLGIPAQNVEMNFGISPTGQQFDLLLNNKKLNIDENYLELKIHELVETLNMAVSDPNTIVIFGKKKNERKANSLRRSNFIGVSKNGPNWQAMISILKRKAYIGTFTDEQEAGLAFDFYSILIHKLDAKTNYNYTKAQIMEMLYSFRSNGNKFIPKALSGLLM